MIHNLSSPHESFRNIHFTSGLNIVLARQSGADGSRGSSNGSGKTSLVEAINMLLGVEGQARQTLKKQPFSEIEVQADIDVGEQLVRVSRRPIHDRLSVAADDLDSLFSQPKLLSSDTRPTERREWQTTLASEWFHVPDLGFGFEGCEPNPASLLRYIARLDAIGGMADPQRNFRTQAKLDGGVNLSYLLGGPWKEAGAWGTIRDKERALSGVQKLSKTKVGFLNKAFGFDKDVPTEIKKLENEIGSLVRESRSIDAFGDRQALIQDLDRVQRAAQDAGQALANARREIRLLDAALDDESSVDLNHVYRGLPEPVRQLLIRDWAEVEAFYHALSSNRRVYLAESRQVLEGRLPSLEERHDAALARLKDAVAANQAQGLLAELQQRARLIERKRAELRYLENAAKVQHELKKERIATQRQKQQNQLELNRAITEGQEHLEYLDQEFRRIINEVHQHSNLKSGLHFVSTEDRLDVHAKIEHDDAAGVKRLDVWAVDLLCKHMEAKLGYTCGILVHDSPLFDPIDGAQIPRMLDVARRRAEVEGWQYIVTFNESSLPDLEPHGLGSCINNVVLDDTFNGSLYGFRNDDEFVDA